MNVKQLIAALEHCDDDDEVHFAYPAGDHHRTTLCPPVTYLDEGLITHSGYFRQMYLTDDDHVQEDTDPPLKSVVILR